MKKYLSGLRFGMLLQLAVGPMCLMVFNTAKDSGLLNALALVLAIALVDAFYITLAGFGVSKVLKNKKVSIIFKFVGAIVLVLFGLNIILGVFDIHIIPGLNVKPSTSSLFLQGLILTLSSPMTIVFWGSILTSKIVEEKFKTKELIAFSIGLVSSTLIFLSFVAVVGTFISSFIPEIVSKVLNIIVGLFIIFFGLKLVFKGDEKKDEV